MTLNQKKLWGISLVVLVPLAVLGVALAVFIGMQVYRMFNPYLDREISGAVTLTSEWLEITPEEPLRTERQVQYLYIYTMEPFDPDNESWGIRFPDGLTVVPQVQLVDHNGNSYRLRGSSFSLADRTRADVISGIGFHASDLPQDRDYRMIRVRSDRPVRVSSIVWRNYNPRDRK